MTNTQSTHQAQTQNSKREVFRFFTWLGFVGFGGPQAHIALMQEHAQARRGWLSQAEFSEALAVCNILPGPASTQLATYLGWKRGGGVVGGLVAAVGFIWPAFSLMLLLSWLYFSFGALPQVNAFFYGLKPVVVAIVLATCWRLAQPSRRDWRFWLVSGLTTLLIGGQFLNDFLVFIGAALLGLVLYPWPPRSEPGARLSSPDDKASKPELKLKSSLLAGLIGLSQVAGQFGFFSYATDWLRLARLGWFFLRAGSLIFGGGLVIIPLIQNEIVDGYGWLSSQQFIDGAALGQATPGPVLVTAAFVGYASAGLVGAAVATFCIFLPGLSLVLLAAPALQRVKQFPPAQSALKGVNGAVVGSLLAGAYFIGQSAFFFGTTNKTFDPYPGGLALLALWLIIRYKTNTIYLFLGAGVLGLGLSLLPFRLPLSGLA